MPLPSSHTTGRTVPYPAAHDTRLRRRCSIWSGSSPRLAKKAARKASLMWLAPAIHPRAVAGRAPCPFPRDARCIIRSTRVGRRFYCRHRITGKRRRSQPSRSSKMPFASAHREYPIQPRTSPSPQREPMHRLASHAQARPLMAQVVTAIRYTARRCHRWRELWVIESLPGGRRYDRRASIMPGCSFARPARQVRTLSFESDGRITIGVAHFDHVAGFQGEGRSDRHSGLTRRHPPKNSQGRLTE